MYVYMSENKPEYIKQYHTIGAVTRVGEPPPIFFDNNHNFMYDCKGAPDGNVDIHLCKESNLFKGRVTHECHYDKELTNIYNSNIGSSQITKDNKTYNIHKCKLKELFLQIYKLRNNLIKHTHTFYPNDPTKFTQLWKEITDSYDNYKTTINNIKMNKLNEIKNEKENIIKEEKKQYDILQKRYDETKNNDGKTLSDLRKQLSQTQSSKQSKIDKLEILERKPAKTIDDNEEIASLENTISTKTNRISLYENDIKDLQTKLIPLQKQIDPLLISITEKSKTYDDKHNEISKYFEHPFVLLSNKDIFVRFDPQYNGDIPPYLNMEMKSKKTFSDMTGLYGKQYTVGNKAVQGKILTLINHPHMMYYRTKVKMFTDGIVVINDSHHRIMSSIAIKRPIFFKIEGGTIIPPSGIHAGKISIGCDRKYSLPLILKEVKHLIPTVSNFGTPDQEYDTIGYVERLNSNHGDIIYKGKGNTLYTDFHTKCIRFDSFKEQIKNDCATALFGSYQLLKADPKKYILQPYEYDKIKKYLK